MYEAISRRRPGPGVGRRRAGPVAGLCGLLAPGVANAASVEPTASASTQVAAPGRLVYVTGMNWAPLGGTTTVYICGRNASGSH